MATEQCPACDGTGEGNLGGICGRCLGSGTIVVQ